MTSVPLQPSSRDREGPASTGAPSTNSIVTSFLIQNEPIFRNLDALREKGWANPLGDDYFKQQRSRADNSNKGAERKFFKMMQEIGDELQAETNALSQTSRFGEDVKVLDLCMAPGGYTASALKYNPTATACGITLPRQKGGHDLLLKSSRSSVMFLDITMLAKEYGIEEVPTTHPEHLNFLDDRPYLEHKFDLVFCDGQVLRTHERPEHREHYEALRLRVSQLILALNRIRPGGTLIMLLHKVETWDTTELLHQFSQFSSIQLFKPAKKHAIRSSFYLVAKNVQPSADAAKQAMEAWKRAWWRATFGGQNGTGTMKAVPDEVHVRTVLSEFGEELIRLGRAVWEIQANALSRMDFVK